MVVQQAPDRQVGPSTFTGLIKFLSTLKGDLANITAPPSFLAPQSVVENPKCWSERPAVFAAPALEKDPLKRSLLVLRMFLVGLHNQFYVAGHPGVSIKKPLNAFLGELFLASWTDSKSGIKTRLVSEQVSHHPPITAMHISSPEHGISAEGYARVEMAFNGSLNIHHMGHTTIHINQFDEDYFLPFPNVQVRGFLSACLYPEIWGTYKILCSSGYVSEITFAGSGFLRGRKKNSFEAMVYHKDSPKKVRYQISGIWSAGWQVKDGLTGEILETYDVAAPENAPDTQELDPVDEQDPWESRRAWRDVLDGVQRGDWMATSHAKQEVEEAQRRIRRQEKAEGKAWVPLFFKTVPADTYDVFHRTTKGENWDLLEQETKGVWRFTDEGVGMKRKPYRGSLTPSS